MCVSVSFFGKNSWIYQHLKIMKPECLFPSYINIVLLLSCLVLSGVESQKKINYRHTPEKIFAGCLTTKYCYTPEERDVTDENPNCIETASCKHLIAIGGGQVGDKNTEDEMVIEMYAESKAWIGMGFSHDNKMGDEYVIGCLRPNISTLPHSTTIISSDILPNVTNSWNKPLQLKPRGERGNQIIVEMGNIKVVERYVSELAIYCKFYLKKKFTKVDPYENKTHNFALSKKYCMLVAWSDRFYYKYANAIDQLGDHYSKYKVNEKNGGQVACKTPMSMDTIYQPIAKQKVYLQFHGICMILTWTFFVSVGNFVGCFYKDIYKNHKTCRMRTWLLLHCFFYVVALGPMVIGLLLHIVGQTGWKNHDGRNIFHIVAGYSVIILFIISMLSGMFLMAKKDLSEYPESKMNYVVFFHKVTSHASHFLANLVLASSPELQFSGLSCHFSYVVIGWMVAYLFLCVLMIFHTFWGSIIAEEPVDADDPLARINALLTDSNRDVEEHPYTMCLKRIVLYVFATISLLMAITLVLMLIWPPVRPCFNQESDLFFDNTALARYRKQSLHRDEQAVNNLDDVVTFTPIAPSTVTVPMPL